MHCHIPEMSLQNCLVIEWRFGFGKHWTLSSLVSCFLLFRMLGNKGEEQFTHPAMLSRLNAFHWPLGVIVLVSTE